VASGGHRSRRRARRQALARIGLGLIAVAACVSGRFAEAQQKRPSARPAPSIRPMPPVIEHDFDRLPPAVAKMRTRILEAAATGDIEAMRIPIEVNELPPIFQRDVAPPGDALAKLKSLSVDPEGRQILARLVNVLSHGFAQLEKGRPGEEYLFPYFAALPPAQWSVQDWHAVWRIATPESVRASIEANTYQGDRLAIGADGTWHYFFAGR
jgi:hypothetical protein